MFWVNQHKGEDPGIYFITLFYIARAFLILSQIFHENMNWSRCKNQAYWGDWCLWVCAFGTAWFNWRGLLGNATDICSECQSSLFLGWLVLFVCQQDKAKTAERISKKEKKEPIQCWPGNGQRNPGLFLLLSLTLQHRAKKKSPVTQGITRNNPPKSGSSKFNLVS